MLRLIFAAIAASLLTLPTLANAEEEPASEIAPPSAEELAQMTAEEVVEAYAEQSLEQRRSSLVDYIGAVVIISDDPDALAPWYIEVLGIPLEGGPGFYHCGVGNTAGAGREFTRMAVYSSEMVPDFVPGGSFGVVFHVADFDEAVRRAMADETAAASLQFISDMEGQFATFKDPDGNTVTIWNESGTIPADAKMIGQ